MIKIILKNDPRNQIKREIPIHCFEINTCKIKKKSLFFASQLQQTGLKPRTCTCVYYQCQCRFFIPVHSPKYSTMQFFSRNNFDKVYTKMKWKYDPTYYALYYIDM